VRLDPGLHIVDRGCEHFGVVGGLDPLHQILAGGQGVEGGFHAFAGGIWLSACRPARERRPENLPQIAPEPPLGIVFKTGRLLPEPD
jgi:hypothetical protein